MDEKYPSTAISFCKLSIIINMHLYSEIISSAKKIIFALCISSVLYLVLNISKKPTYSSKLRVQTKCYEHEEEKDGPQWRYGKFGQGIRVSNESQSKPFKWAGKQTYSHCLVIFISQSIIPNVTLVSENMQYTSKYYVTVIHRL